MSKIIMVTGGARSGKSGFAESLLRNRMDVLYVATSIPFDEEMKDRIKKHRQTRPDTWETIECYRDVDEHLREKNKKYVLLDCLTIMVTNLMFNYEEDWDNISMDRTGEAEKMIALQIGRIIGCARELDMEVIIVTNELGMGIVPSNRLSRLFRDIAGRMNQLVAKECDEVYLMVSGIPVRIK